jgi:hypothetical protein
MEKSHCFAYSPDSALSYQVAIFMLPGDQVPVVRGEAEFAAKFVRKYFKKIYVPAKGKICRNYEVVC